MISPVTKRIPYDGKLKYHTYNISHDSNHIYIYISVIYIILKNHISGFPMVFYGKDVNFPPNDSPGPKISLPWRAATKASTLRSRACFLGVVSKVSWLHRVYAQIYIYIYTM